MPREIDPFMTPKEAAALLRVSTGYLRSSDCPKILLPTQGKRAIVRYRKSEVEAWAEKFAARSHIQLRRAG